MIQKETSLFWEMILSVIVSKTVHINMCLILKNRDDKVAAIQGDSKGNITILGDIIGHCEHNSSHKHVSDFIFC